MTTAELTIGHGPRCTCTDEQLLAGIQAPTCREPLTTDDVDDLTTEDDDAGCTSRCCVGDPMCPCGGSLCHVGVGPMCDTCGCSGGCADCADCQGA